MLKQSLYWTELAIICESAEDWADVELRKRADRLRRATMGEVALI